MKPLLCSLTINCRDFPFLFISQVVLPCHSKLFVVRLEIITANSPDKQFKSLKMKPGLTSKRIATISWTVFQAKQGKFKIPCSFLQFSSN